MKIFICISLLIPHNVWGKKNNITNLTGGNEIDYIDNVLLALVLLSFHAFLGHDRRAAKKLKKISPMAIKVNLCFNPRGSYRDTTYLDKTRQSRFDKYPQTVHIEFCIKSFFVFFFQINPAFKIGFHVWIRVVRVKPCTYFSLYNKYNSFTLYVFLNAHYPD